MSSGGGKGGKANPSYNYYGTLAGAIGWGPLDWLTAVIANGNYLFHGYLTLTDDVTDLSGSLLDPKMLASGGYLKLYRGTATQPADDALAGHPPYRDTIVLVAKHIYFGQDAGTAPNLQVIGGRRPRVTTDIVAAIDNVVDDKQVNPIAWLAEFILDERGGGLSSSQLDAASWLASAHWCAQDADHRAATFCSPLVADQGSFADVAKALLDPLNGFLRWTAEGKLACVIYEWGVDPGGLATLDERHFTAKGKFTDGDWTAVKTEVVVNFTDRDYEFQQNTVVVPNARAAQIRQLDDQGKLDRPHITRIAQAHRQGTEYNRRLGTAPGTGTLKVRQPVVAELAVGDKLYVNMNPEPGGSGSAQLCRVEKIVQDRTDEAELTVMPDTLLAASPYTPDWITSTTTPATCAPLTYALAIPLPPASYGLPPTVGILATRPSRDVVGFEVLFGTDSGLPFADLGSQIGFAVRAQLNASLTAVATTAAFTELDGVDGADAPLAANTPGGNNAEAEDNTLLAILATLDGSGRVALDGTGAPIMEFVSIVSRAAVSGATFNYTVLRGRLGTTALAWSAATPVWIIPEVNLVAWNHYQFTDLQGTLLLFRLLAYNSSADATTTLEADLNLPPVPPPPVVTLGAYPASPLVGRTYFFTGSISALYGDLVSYKINAALYVGGVLDAQFTLQTGDLAPADQALYNFNAAVVFPAAGTWRIVVEALNSRGTLGTAQTSLFTVAEGTGLSGADDGLTPDVVSGVTLTPGFNIIYLQWVLPTTTPVATIAIYESATTTQPSTPTFYIPAPVTYLGRDGLAANTQRYYWFQVVGRNGRLGTVAGPFSATTKAGVGSADILAGAVLASHIAANTITAFHLAAGTIVATSISSQTLLIDNFAGACAVFDPRKRLDDDIWITTNLTWRVDSDGYIEIQYATFDPTSHSMGAYYGNYFAALRPGDAVIFYGAGYCSENCAAVYTNNTSAGLLKITRPLNGTSPGIAPSTYRTNNGQIYFVSLGAASRNVHTACYSIGKDAIVLNFESDITQSLDQIQLATNYGAWGSSTYTPPSITAETILSARGSVFNSWSADVYCKSSRSIMFRLNDVQPRYGMVSLTRLL